MISMYLEDAADLIQATPFGGNPKFTGCSTDSRIIREGEMFIALEGEFFDGHDFIEMASGKGACAAMVEHQAYEGLPGILVENTRHSMGSLAQKWRENFNIPLIAITGSNGKTTVKEMLTSILQRDARVLYTKGNYNNDIGVPLTLFNLGDEHDYAVIEMGANHPGEISWLTRIAQPSLAVITQCAPAHLEGFENIEGVAKAKAEIYEGLHENGIALINRDDDYADFWIAKTRNHRQLTFGISSSADIKAVSISPDIESGYIRFRLLLPDHAIDISLPLLGEHNVMNALAASACAYGLNISADSIKLGLEELQSIPGRLQLKKGIKGSRILDDTYNANPASLAAAVDVLSEYEGERWLVLGDMGELGNSSEQLHESSGHQAKSRRIDRLFTIGDLSINAHRDFGDQARHFESLDCLMSSLIDEISPGVTILVKGSRSMKMERVVNALMDNS